MVVQLKCCPKCIGDVFLERGLDGEEWVCIQCGYRYEILVIARARVLDGGRRVGIVQVAQAFDVRFDRAADGDLSRTEWGPDRRLSREKPHMGHTNLPEPAVVEGAELAGAVTSIRSLRGAA